MSFTELVARYFEPLARTHGLTTVHTEEHSSRSMAGLVEYRSEKARLAIALEKGQVCVDLGPASSDRWHDLWFVVNALHPEADFSYSMLPRLDDETLEPELRRLRDVLSNWCVPQLLGDFSRAEEIERFARASGEQMRTRFQARVEEVHRRRAGGDGGAKES
jgi:hypothetical protein